MDRIDIKGKILDFAKKYRYVILVLAAGLILMCLPEREPEPPEPEAAQEIHEADNLEDRLEEVLSSIEGVGRVEILLTQRAGESVLYQTDSDSASGTDTMSERQETVIITDSDRREQGLIRQINPPLYQGAVVVCQGGDDPTVRLAVVEAVSDATGLGADKISVLKMK